jgi:uncharacterized protein YaaW (UPF0174 family)
MSYRDDKDLEFLMEVPSSDLNALVEVLTINKDGIEHFTEELTEAEVFQKYHPDHHEYWALIAAEIQCYGGNTFANLLRGGEGVVYNELLRDACDKLKVNYNKDASIEIIEMNLMMKILIDSLEKMSPEELKDIAADLKIKTTNFTAQALTIALQGAIKFGGFLSYQVALIVANAVARAILGHGLRVGTNAALARSIGIFAGPIGWVLTGLWTVVDIAGPAYRITIPAVIQVGFLRAKLNHDK